MPKTTHERMQDYYATPGISQSQLVALSKGLGSYKKEQELYFKETPHYDMGDLLETLILYPHATSDLFYVSDILTKPSTKATSIIRQVWDATREHAITFGEEIKDLQEYPDIILSAAEAHDFGGTTWSDERKLKDIITKGAEYWESLRNAEGKTIMSNNQYETCLEMKYTLDTHAFTRDLLNIIFRQLDGFGHDVLEVYIQQPIYFEHRGHQCKALPDVYIYNTGNIAFEIGALSIPPKGYLLLDIKTIGDSVKKFPTSVKRWRYDVQMAWYKLALESQHEGDTLVLPVYLVKSTIPEEYPLLYGLRSYALNIAQWGAYYTKGEYIPAYDMIDTGQWDENKLREQWRLDRLGYEQMLYLHEWHTQEAQWDYDREIAENSGYIAMELYRNLG